VVAARKAPIQSTQVLPGSALPLLEAAIYPRTSGYLKSRQVDIGDRVEEGQLLAEIVTPEIDAQLEMARATLLQSKATLLKDQAQQVLTQLNMDRAKQLKVEQGISQQEFDTNDALDKAAVATVQADQAMVKANQADIVRLEALQSFEKVTAAFPGVITAKNVDPGDLVTANSPSTTKEMFHLMRIDTLRVFVYLPQVFASDVKVGQSADVYRKENPQKKFKGTVTRTANALDPNTRTLLTEVDVPNPTGELLPGMYLQVRFIFQREVVPVLIPTAALATRTDGPRVAVLDDQHQVHYRSLMLGRDYGAEIEVIAGLNAGETVVVHPGDDIPEWTVVDAVPLPASKAGS
jgi:RND family efflux transporter MFP subunit